MMGRKGTVDRRIQQEVPAGQPRGELLDDFTGGATAPGWDEMIADIDAAKDYGCIGVSFFEWQTATQEQWQAVSRYPW